MQYFGTNFWDLQVSGFNYFEVGTCEKLVVITISDKPFFFFSFEITSFVLEFPSTHGNGCEVFVSGKLCR